jgi:copper chaperone
MAETTLTAPDISCQHCKATIEKGLSDARGVRRVEVDVEGRSVALDYDPEETDEDALRHQLAELGYPVS